MVGQVGVFQIQSDLDSASSIVVFIVSLSISHGAGYLLKEGSSCEVFRVWNEEDIVAISSSVHVAR